MIKKLIATILCGGALFTVALRAQTPDTVIAGPYGVPRLVRTDGGQWSEPIKVFSDINQVVYIPDITTPGWAQWHAQEFKSQGTYSTYVYTYLRKQRVTVQELVYVNTQTQHIVVERFLKPPLHLDANTSPPTITKTVANITKIVQDCIANFHGPFIQDVINQQKIVTARMAVQLDQGGPRACATPHATNPPQYAYASYSPQLISVPTPKYPQENLDSHVSSTVMVSVTVMPDGTTTDLCVSMSSTSPTLETAALQAAQQARFEPAHDHITGAAIAAPAALSFNFPAH
jgi:TonB family protein